MTELKFRYWLQYSDNHTEAHFFTIEDIENHRGLNRKALFEAGIEILSRDRYTELKDTNKKEIYKDDWLQWNNDFYLVKWDNISGCWYGEPHFDNINTGILTAQSFFDCENIGPEWVKEAKNEK